MQKVFLKIFIELIILIFILTLVLVIRALKPTRLPISLTPDKLGLPYEKISLKTTDGKKLAGWLIISEKSDSIIICLHGYPANKADILPLVSFLYPDFSLLLFDFRAHGESEGTFTSFGLKERFDVDAAIKFIRENEKTKKFKKIGIFGYSLGGAVGILAAVNNKIDAIVTDSAFSNFPEMIPHYYKNFGPLKYVFSFLSKQLAKYILGMDFTLNSPENVIGELKCPLLIIHSQEDELIPVEHARRLYERAKVKKELYIIKGSHLPSDRGQVREYPKKVKDFFKKYLSSN